MLAQHLSQCYETAHNMIWSHSPAGAKPFSMSQHVDDLLTIWSQWDRNDDNILCCRSGHTAMLGRNLSLHMLQHVDDMLTICCHYGHNDDEDNNFADE